MKRFFKLSIITGLLHLSSCSVLEQAQEVQRFIQCDFALEKIQVLEVGGLQVANLKSPEDIGFLNMMSLTNQVLNGTLPAKISIGIRASNNNTATASVAGFEWKLLMKGENYLNGEIDRSVEVLPQSTAVFPVNVEMDLFKVLQRESVSTLLNFVFSENKAQELKNMGIGLKIKPYYKVGAEIQKYPGYLEIEF